MIKKLYISLIFVQQDACLELLRSCFKVSATMEEKTTFSRHVQQELEKLGLPAPYTRNLLHG